jgi:hypothetical protein
MGGGGAASAPLFQNDPYQQFAVVRGPQVFDPQANPPASAVQVDTSLVEMDSKVSEGSAAVNRPLALFQSLGRISFDVRHPLVESHWRFSEMGYGGNQSRRIEQLLHPAILTKGSVEGRKHHMPLRVDPRRQRVGI